VVVPGSWAEDEGCRDFAENLERMLQGFGWSRAELAVRCNYSVSVVQNILGFQRAPNIEHGASFDRSLGLKDVFAAKARAIRGESFPPAFRPFTEDEARATDLFIFEHSMIPGLFQTDQYALATLARHPNTNEATVRERVAGRLARQQILTRDEPAPPRVWALLDEAALRRDVGDAAIMRDQLMRLLELWDMPNVTIQVIPGMEVHVGLLGAFTIAEWPGQAGIVNVEDITDGRVRDEPAKVDQVRLTFRAMQTEALHVRASRDLIARMAEEVWNGSAPTGARALTAAPTEASA
jgi:hypothetical protein